MTTSAAQFLEETRTFANRALALPAVSSYYCYHTVALDSGLTAPGLHDTAAVCRTSSSPRTCAA
jgi:hypothetical protein